MRIARVRRPLAACRTGLVGGGTATVVAVAALVFSGVAGASPSKPYNLTISPSSEPAQQAVTMQATFSIPSGASQGIGSANLVAPAGFTVGAPGACPTDGSTPPSGGLSGAGNACVDSAGVIELRGLGITPGGPLSETLTMTVTTPACGATSGVYSWSAIAKQANNFNGTGNNLGPATNSPNPLVTTIDCGLAFSTEPANALVGQTISGSPDNPLGPPIAVQVLDNNGNPDTTSTEPITISLGSNPGNATLSGTKTVSASGGVAQFSNLSLNVSEHGYTLVATSGSSNTTSTGFDINDQQTTCTQSSTKTSQSCSNTESAGGGQSTLTVTANGDPKQLNTTQLEVSADEGTDTLNCAGLAPVSPNWFTFQMGNALWSGTFHLVEKGTGLLANVGPALGGNQTLCYGQRTNFVTMGTTNGQPNATAGTLPNGKPGFIGLLPTCGTAGATVCISGRSQPLDFGAPLGWDLVWDVSVPQGLMEDPSPRG